MSKLRTQLAVDDPVALSADYKLGAADRRKIDDQVLDLQQMMVDNLLKGAICSWYTLSPSSSPLTAGMAFCTGADGLMTAGTDAAIAAAGSPTGISVGNVPAGAKFRGILMGSVPPEISGLGAGAAGNVRLHSSTGMLERAAVPSNGDILVGFTDATGAVTIRGLPGAAAAGVHSQQLTSDGIHTTLGLGPYDTIAHRRAAVLTASDRGKHALQTDTDPPTEWTVLKVSGGVGSWGLCATAEVTFAGDFSAIPGITGLLAYTQPDQPSGLVEGTTLAHTAGSGPVLTFSGTRTSPQATPIWVTCDTTGGARGTWVYKIYYNGTGTGSPDMTGTSAATVVLTGAGAGLTLNIAAGTAVTTDVWKATCASCVDFVAAVNYAQATAASQPIITKSNGRIGLSTVGGRFMASSLDLPAPTVFLVSVFRILATPGSTGVLYGGDTGFFMCVRAGLSGGIDQYNGTVGNALATAPPVGTISRLEAKWSNSTGDYLKAGATQSTLPGTNTGATNPASGRSFGAIVTGSSPVDMEHLMDMYFNAEPSSTVKGLISTYSTSWFGAAA